MMKGRFASNVGEGQKINQSSHFPMMKTRMTRQHKPTSKDQQCITNFFKLNQFKDTEPQECEITLTMPPKITFCKQDYLDSNYKNGMIITSLEKPPKIQQTGQLRLPGSPLHRIELNSDNINPKTKYAEGSIHKTEHKLTEYFPIRRSVRKTKKTVLEEKQKCLEKQLRSGIEDGLEINNFNGKGRGVVATKPFSRGDFVVEYSGELLDIIQAKQREEMYSKDTNTGCYMYYFNFQNRQYCVDATAETGRLGRLVNHSRNGNLATRTVVVDTLPRLVLIAKDYINVGEELCYDYGDRSKESLKNHPWLAL